MCIYLCIVLVHKFVILHIGVGHLALLVLTSRAMREPQTVGRVQVQIPALFLYVFYLLF